MAPILLAQQWKAEEYNFSPMLAGPLTCPNTPSAPVHYTSELLTVQDPLAAGDLSFEEPSNERHPVDLIFATPERRI
jgi:hypothetical protein